MYQDQGFSIYIIYLFQAVQIPGKLGSSLGQKLTNFPTSYCSCTNEIAVFNFFFHWYVADEETNKMVLVIFFFSSIL